MLPQHFSQTVSIKFFYKKNETEPAKLLNADLEFIGFDEKGIKGNLKIKDRSIFFVWDNSFKDNGYPKYNYTWIDKDLPNQEECKNIIKQALDKFCRIALKVNPLDIKIANNSNDVGVVAPKRINNKLQLGFISNPINMTPEQYIFASAILRQLNIWGGSCFKNTTDSSFSSELESRIQKLKDSKYA